MTVILRQGTQDQYSNTIVLGAGLRVDQTSDGLPQLSAGTDIYLTPSGGDDTAAIQAAMYASNRVRLAPGTFTISNVIDISEGVTLSGAGSGSGAQGGTPMTKIVVGAIGNPAIRFGDSTQFAGLESLRLVGPGKGVGNQGAIKCARSTSTIYPIARRLRFRDLHIEGFNQDAMLVDKCAQVEIENVTVKNTGKGITFSGGGSHRMSTVRLEGCDGGFVFDTTTGIVVDACEAEDCADSFKVYMASNVVLNGCVSRAVRGTALEINGANGVVVNGFRSDNSAGAFYDAPHLAVYSSAVNVQVNGFTRVNNPGGTPTYEANVSSAGNTILVGAHNLDHAKIASGGRFGELAFAALP